METIWVYIYNYKSNHLWYSFPFFNFLFMFLDLFDDLAFEVSKQNHFGMKELRHQMWFEQPWRMVLLRGLKPLCNSKKPHCLKGWKMLRLERDHLPTSSSNFSTRSHLSWPFLLPVQFRNPKNTFVDIYCPIIYQSGNLVTHYWYNHTNHS